MWEKNPNIFFERFKYSSKYEHYVIYYYKKFYLKY